MQRVHGRRDAGRVHHLHVGVEAIERVIVVLRTGTVHRVQAGAGLGRAARLATRHRTSAGHQQNEAGEVASVDGQAFEFFSRDDVADRRFLSLQNRCRAGDLDGIGDRAEGEVEVHFEDGAHREIDVLANL